MTQPAPLPLAVLLVLALVLGLAWGSVTPTILRRLPEPESGPEPGAEAESVSVSVSVSAAAELPSADELDPKIPYAALATRPFAATVGGLAALATALPGLSLPPALLPPWLVLATLGVLLAAIDARTTWLPLRLTRIAWVALAGAVVVTGLLAGWAVALRGVVGFTLAAAIFGAIWLATRGGFGFGDVRYAPLVGAATASVSWTVLSWGLVLGSLVGAVAGLSRLARRRRGAFAYAPSILAGGYLAVALAWLTT